MRRKPKATRDWAQEVALVHRPAKTSADEKTNVTMIHNADKALRNLAHRQIRGKSEANQRQISKV